MVVMVQNTMQQILYMEGFSMKKAIRLIVVIITLGIALAVCDHVLLLKSKDGIEQIHSFYMQKENTVDVLFLGSSHVYCNINTGTLWDEYGMASFDLGGAEQPYWNSYYYLKEALKTQRPKVIVFEITTPGIRETDFQPENWLICNTYGMRWSENRIEAIKNSSVEQSFERLLNPFNSIHNRYKDLSEEDFIDSQRDISNKGFDPRETVIPFEQPDISSITETAPITEKAELYLNKIIDYAEQENIPLLLLTAPYTVKEEAQKRYNYVFSIAESRQVPYLDSNKMYDEIGLDFSTDMADDLHLNRTGNAKFSKFLGQYLLDRYEIEDRRGEEKYDSWETDALRQRMSQSEFVLHGTYDLSNYLTQINNEHYVSMIFLGNNFSETVTDDGVLKQLQAAGFSEQTLANNQAFFLNGSHILFQNNLEEFKWSLDAGEKTLLCSREQNEYGDIATTVYVDEEKYSIGLSGITMVIYDKIQNKVVDYVNFDAQNGFAAFR